MRSEDCWNYYIFLFALFAFHIISLFERTQILHQFYFPLLGSLSFPALFPHNLSKFAFDCKLSSLLGVVAPVPSPSHRANSALTLRTSSPVHIHLSA